jgi:hypothetical protein
MSNETEIALMRRDREELRLQLAVERMEIDKLKELDNKRMRAAVVTLFGIVISLGIYIWAFVVEGRFK